MKKHYFFVFLLSFFLSNYCFADVRMDGNWWNTLSRSEKVVYVAGFMDGVVQGDRIFDAYLIANPILIKEMKTGKGTELLKYAASAEQAAKSGIHKLFTNSPYGQVADGLDSLYADYKNRRIYVLDGVLIVGNNINGMSESAFEKLKEHYRKQDSNN